MTPSVPLGLRSLLQICAQALALMLALLPPAWAALAAAAPDDLPPRTQWRATASAPTTPEQAPQLAIDADERTRWGGAFSPGHWWQLDLGAPATLAGVALHWDSNHAAVYRILLSGDGHRWRTAYRTRSGVGRHELIIFPAQRARYLRLASVDPTADWNTSIYTLEPLAAATAPAIEGLKAKVDGRALAHGGDADNAAVRAALRPQEPLRIVLPQARPLAGVALDWDQAPRHAQLLGCDAQARCVVVAEDPEARGVSRSLLAASQAQAWAELRVIVSDAARVKRLRLLGADEASTPLRRYQDAAQRAAGPAFPPTARQQQVYWTVVGLPAGRHKSALSEYGEVEAFKGAPLLQALWRDARGALHGAHSPGAQPRQQLQDGWMPQPRVSWWAEPGLRVHTQALAVPHAGQPATLVRYRLVNEGRRPVHGDLALVLRPMQLNPPWQIGGMSPLNELAVLGPLTKPALTANGRLLWQVVQDGGAGVQAGAAPFGSHGQTEATRLVQAGQWPHERRVRDADGMASAVLRWPVHLAPGAAAELLLAAPLDGEPFEVKSAGPGQPAPAWPASSLWAASTPPAWSDFDALWREGATAWTQRLDRVTLALPDADLVNAVRAQLVYMLLNQSGSALQPGPRNYNRAFIRDGSASAIVLARMGLLDVARGYLDWTARHAVHANGLVSPILNTDGSVNRGFGSDLEHDSQGQFIHLVAELARVQGGAESVRSYAPQVRAALRFLQELRERTLVPGYAEGREAPERFRGILAPSISHEGYSVATHSYWDDYWGLRGWLDGAWLLDAWGDAGAATWAREQYQLLRESLRASIRATMAWKGLDEMPASADLGDTDPTSVSIGLDPAGQADLMPPVALSNTFERYLAGVKARAKAGSLWAYTPYEMRNVLTFVRLSRAADADALLRALLSDRRPRGWHVFAEVVHSRERHPGYLGDMPHTWVGAELVRGVLGMLVRDDPDGPVQLLPGVPKRWLQGQGLHVAGLALSAGTLDLRARLVSPQRLRVELAPGLRADSPLRLNWPLHGRPRAVWIDGRPLLDGIDDQGLTLTGQPAGVVEAQW